MGDFDELVASGRKLSETAIRKKIILSGESCVGKTALLHSYTDQYYQSYHNATIGHSAVHPSPAVHPSGAG